MHLVSSATASAVSVSKHNISSGPVTIPQSSISWSHHRSTPVTVSSLSVITCEQKHEVSTGSGSQNLQAPSHRMEAGMNPNVAIAVTVSKYNIGSGPMSIPWSFRSTPVTISSVSGSTCERQLDVSTVSGSRILQAPGHRTEAGVRPSFAISAEDRQSLNSWQRTRRLNSPLSVHSNVTTSPAYSANQTASQRSGVEHVLMSAAAPGVQKPHPDVATVFPTSTSQFSTTLSTSFSSSSVFVPVVNSQSSGAVDCVSAPANSAKSLRLVIQPSSVAVATQSEVMMKFPQSVYQMPTFTVSHVPPATSRPKPAMSSETLRTCSIRYRPDSDCSSTYSGLVGSSLTLVSGSCSAVPLPRITDSLERLSESAVDQQISSAVHSSETQHSAGKYDLMFIVDCLVFVVVVFLFFLKFLFFLTLQKYIILCF